MCDARSRLCTIWNRFNTEGAAAFQTSRSGQPASLFELTLSVASATTAVRTFAVRASAKVACAPAEAAGAATELGCPLFDPAREDEPRLSVADPEPQHMPGRDIRGEKPYPEIPPIACSAIRRPQPEASYWSGC